MLGVFLWMCAHKQHPDFLSWLWFKCLICKLWLWKTQCFPSVLDFRIQNQELPLWSIGSTSGVTKFTSSFRVQLQGTHVSVWQTVSGGMNDDLRGPGRVRGDVFDGKVKAWNFLGLSRGAAGNMLRRMEGCRSEICYHQHRKWYIILLMHSYSL